MIKAHIQENPYLSACEACSLPLTYSDINEGLMTCPRCLTSLKTDAERPRLGSFTFEARGKLSHDSWRGIYSDKDAYTDLDAMFVHDKIMGAYGNEPYITGGDNVFKVFPCSKDKIEEKVLDFEAMGDYYLIQFYGE